MTNLFFLTYRLKINWLNVFSWFPLTLNLYVYALGGWFIIKILCYKHLWILNAQCNKKARERVLTAAIEGFLLSPAGGWVTSAPRNITGSLNTLGLQRWEFHSVREGIKQFIFTFTHWDPSNPQNSLTLPLGFNNLCTESAYYDEIRWQAFRC